MLFYIETFSEIKPILQINIIKITYSNLLFSTGNLFSYLQLLLFVMEIK